MKSDNLRLVRPAMQKWQTLGDILLAEGKLSHTALCDALIQQEHQNARLGEVLVATGSVGEMSVLRALGRQFNLPIYNNYGQKVSVELLQLLSVSDCLALGCVPVSRLGNYLKLIIADPNKRAAISAHLRDLGLIAVFYLTTQAQLHEKLLQLNDTSLIEKSEISAFIGSDAQVALASARSVIPLFVLPFLLILAIGLPILAMPVLLLSMGCFFAGLIIRLIASFAAPIKQHDPDRVLPDKIPKVSLLIPLYKEADMVKKLFLHLRRLDYPTALLEIVFICESDDLTTQQAIRDLPLGVGDKLIICPKGKIKTKPRAMNYALPFTTGQIIGIYDAEDAPECDQIRKAVAALNGADDRVVCVQAQLDFFNQDSNWMARCFTLEYAAYYRLIIRGVARLDWPIPLGGTSAFIKRDVLEKIGLWDAYNVTEDAELGLRLYRLGYRVRPINSVTYEEANNRIWPWVKQRSRWQKGFYVTWVTHIKRPLTLLREGGLGAFLFINTWFFTGLITAQLATPLFLFCIFDFYFGRQQLFPSSLQNYVSLFWLAFIVAEVANFVILWRASGSAKHIVLRKTIPSMIFYWPLQFLAMCKAFFELIFAPSYWEKTEHGVDHGVPIDSVYHLTDRITQNPWHSTVSVPQKHEKDAA